MAKKYYEYEQKMKAYSSASRLRILSYLKNHPSATVGDLADLLDVSESAISQHLRFLKSAEVVIPIRRGMFTSYRLPLKKDPILRAVLKEL